MLDDEVTIMNEISRPPPPPPPDREGGRRQDTWDRDRQNRGNRLASISLSFFLLSFHPFHPYMTPQTHMFKGSYII